MTARYAAPRPRRARILAASVSAVVVVASTLGAAGALPLAVPAGADSPAAVPPPAAMTFAEPAPPAGGGQSSAAAVAGEDAAGADATGAEAAGTGVAGPAATTGPGAPAPGPDLKPVATAPLPEGSGSGRRVVYDISDQQVWLVEDDGSVARTYPVSGSRYDQVEPGTYEVYSTSRHATGWHGTETMEHMVRFTRGQRAAIGFHSIPVSAETGEPVQSLAELGTPLSDGCVRQDADDAAAMYDFAPVGTAVVVTR
ncbi:MAG TPA: L,D-transpeptidase [Jiangellales bacterium]|nr:L,D-transpeptidase [Jiangellales bacterium]